jgi:hypothetical protein
MKRFLATSLAAALLAACGGNDDEAPTPPSLGTAAEINTYLAGKSWKMTGADIPSHPNGYDENQNLGAATQCYNETVIATDANWIVTSKLGTLTGAPNPGDIGTCDNATAAGSPLTFTSTAILVENVEGNGACFDITATYTGFAQEGRGKFSADGRTMTLELFFATQAVGADCASGDVGSGGITLNAAAFTGNAQQVYRLQ